MIPRRTAVNALFLSVMAGVGLVLTACASAATPGSRPTTSQDTEPADTATHVIGSWTADTAGTPHLTFSADGAVHGSDGCNGISTTYRVVDEHVEIEQFMSTLKACQGVDGWLQGIRTAEIDGEQLVVMNAAGDRIGELSRS